MMFVVVFLTLRRVFSWGGDRGGEFPRTGFRISSQHPIIASLITIIRSLQYIQHLTYFPQKIGMISSALLNCQIDTWKASTPTRQSRAVVTRATDSQIGFGIPAEIPPVRYSGADRHDSIPYLYQR